MLSSIQSSQIPAYQPEQQTENKENLENCSSSESQKPESNILKKEMDAHASNLSREKIELQVIQEALIESPFFIEAKKVEEILKITKLDVNQLLQKLIPIVKDFARPPISNYFVGAVALGKSGNIYLGVNLEFPGFHLNQTVHGEQCLIANARNHRERSIEAIALSAAPCGHCRQFLNEIGDESLIVLTPGKEPRTISQLLPDAFGPKDLGLTGGLLTPCMHSIKSDHPSPLSERAIDAARSSYAPYTQSFSGVAIKTKDDNIYTGGYLENAAFNPSLSPFHAALAALVADGKRYDDIIEVVLAEYRAPKTSHALLTESTLKSIAPEARFHLEILEL